jgi:hypothetical protein
MAPVIIQLQYRKDTAANWTSTNPVLLSGEPGYETDTGLQKIGDGSNPWNDLEYAGGGTGDGDVVGPEGATNEMFPLFDGVTGKLLKNSTFGPSSFAPLAFTYTDALSFEVNHAHHDEVFFNVTFVNNDYPAYRTGSMYFGSYDDGHAYFYQQTDCSIQEYVGYPDYGGTQARLETIWSGCGCNGLLESATVDGDFDLDSVGGTLYFNFYVWQEASSCTPEVTMELDSPNGKAYISFADGYSGSTEIGVDTGSIAYLKIEGNTGSFVQFGTDNIYLEGTYRPTRYWGSLASAPASSMLEGDEYRNTGDSKFYKYTGSEWVTLN